MFHHRSTLPTTNTIFYFNYFHALLCIIINNVHIMQNFTCFIFKMKLCFWFYYRCELRRCRSLKLPANGNMVCHFQSTSLIQTSASNNITSSDGNSSTSINVNMVVLLNPYCCKLYFKLQITKYIIYVNRTMQANYTVMF